MAATIKLGSSGADVSTWQGLLAQAGYPVPVTGTFDQATDAATRKWQASKALTVDGIVGPASWAAMTGKAPEHAYPAYYAKDADFGRDVLRKVWREVTGEDPNLSELQIAGAQAHLESGYGKSSYRLLNHADGSVLQTSGIINNWGAVQTSSAADGFLATDTSPSKVTAENPKGYYDHHYKKYPTPEAGARHFVEHMTLKRPTSWRLMKRGDIDAWAEQMHSKDPETGIGVYFEQAPAQRARGIEERVWAISDTLGEPVAAKRGGPMPEGTTPGGVVPTGTAGRGAILIVLAAAVYGAWRWWRGGR